MNGVFNTLVSSGLSSSSKRLSSKKGLFCCGVKERERELQRREMASLNGEKVPGGSGCSLVLYPPGVRNLEIVADESCIEWRSVEVDGKEYWEEEGCGGFFLEDVEKREVSCRVPQTSWLGKSQDRISIVLEQDVVLAGSS
jgi:hypothetical protein